MLLYKFQKRRAVSPVIAVILILGLTVLAIAVFSVIVYPMLDDTPTTDKVSLEYNNQTKILYVSNSNMKDIYLDSYVLYDTLGLNYSTPINKIIKSGNAYALNLEGYLRSITLYFDEFTIEFSFP